MKSAWLLTTQPDVDRRYYEGKNNVRYQRKEELTKGGQNSRIYVWEFRVGNG